MNKGQFTAKQWEYKNGEMLTAREISELNEHIELSLLRQRLREHTGDWEHTLRPKENTRAHAKMKFNSKGLGPRKQLEEIQSPTDYERQLWGH